MHINPDYATRKAFKEAVASGVKVRVFQPGPFPGTFNGETVVEAPAHYHKWYAQVIVENGIVVKIKG